ncbi:EpsG family protein [compost metagenome]
MTYISLYDDLIYLVSLALIMFSVAKHFLRTASFMPGLVVLENTLVAGVALLAAWYIGFRPEDTPGDTEIYLNVYKTLVGGGETLSVPFETGFITLIQLLGVGGADHYYFFMVIPFLLLVSYHKLAASIFGSRSSLPLLCVAIIVYYPFFLSLTANVIRQGLAVSFILLALSLVLTEHKKIAGVISISAVLFHRSAVIALPFFMLVSRIVRFSFSQLVAIWLFVSVASYFKVFAAVVSLVFSLLASQGISFDYSSVDSVEYQSGFRFDFWLFSSLSIALFFVLHVLGRKADRVAPVFYISCYFAIVHIAMFDIAFNDRFGVYAWVLFPLQILYLIRCVLGQGMDFSLPPDTELDAQRARKIAGQE